MKKHNEGYSLVLVLVVIIVLSLISTFLLSSSLQNLQRQQKSVDNMVNEYSTVNVPQVSPSSSPQQEAGGIANEG